VSELFGAPIGGWKAASPSAGKVSLGPIYAGDIYFSSPCPVLSRKNTMTGEPEVCFVLGRDLGPRTAAYTEAEVLAAIQETRLAIEVLGGRYADPASVSFPEKLADALNNQALFVGPVVPGALDKPLATLPIAVEGPQGVIVTRDGVHPSGHPLAPLLWLANFLSERGDGLKAGQIVTTGSYCGVLELPLATPLRVRFGDLGILSIEFTQVQSTARGAQQGES
jgi:2-keto-4-pentenoate hydratase